MRSHVKPTLLAACLVLGTAAVPSKSHESASAAPGHPETVTPRFRGDLPNVPGKDLIAVEVAFPPGAASPPHTHPRSAFVYAYVLSGEIVSAVDDEAPKVFRAGDSWTEAPGARHTVTRNNSALEPARLLAIFVADRSERQLVVPEVKQ